MNNNGGRRQEVAARRKELGHGFEMPDERNDIRGSRRRISSLRYVFLFFY